MVSRFPADISAPAWLTMAQYHWLNDTAVTFRSIVVAPDTRRKGDKPVNGARLLPPAARTCPCSSLCDQMRWPAVGRAGLCSQAAVLKLCRAVLFSAYAVLFEQQQSSVSLQCAARRRLR